MTIRIVNNDEHSIAERVLLNLKTAQSFETVLADLGQVKKNHFSCYCYYYIYWKGDVVVVLVLLYSVFNFQIYNSFYSHGYGVNICECLLEILNVLHVSCEICHNKSSLKNIFKIFNFVLWYENKE